MSQIVGSAESLVCATNGRTDILFVAAGDIRLHGMLPGLLGDIKRRRGSLEDYAAAMGVRDMFLFLGHVPDPERVLASCDALAKLTREANPWARDIIEALGAGKPVLSLGRYDRFVEHDVTGILLDAFDPAALAREIVPLADDPDRLGRLGALASGSRPSARAARAAELLPRRVLPDLRRAGRQPEACDEGAAPLD